MIICYDLMYAIPDYLGFVSGKNWPTS